MELDAQGVRMVRRGGLTLAPVNKVHHVQTIARVAEMLGEDEDWLWDVANEMDQEDGLIWVYGPGDDGVMAFTDFGIETLTGLIEIYKADPDLLKRSSTQSDLAAAYAACLHSDRRRESLFIAPVRDARDRSAPRSKGKTRNNSRLTPTARWCRNSPVVCLFPRSAVR